MKNYIYAHMACGCILPVKNTSDLKYCPEHDEPRLFFTRPCLRCGSIEKVQNLHNANFMCEECDKLIQQSKVVYNNHGLDFIDPILWHKTAREVIEDIVDNFFIGYEEIQIDPPIRVQHQKETVTICMKKKIKNLDYMRQRI